VTGTVAPPPALDVDVLRRIEERVLWLSTAMVHHANRVRPNESGVKVGGHQASSASATSIMTALWIAHLRAEDRASVKPHAAPTFHALQYLLGRLDGSFLPRLREFGGLQSYPSRTKDPDDPDYSTGSVGVGATATLWGALTQRYLRERGADVASARHIAILGDAELDEGEVWEALLDPMVAGLGEVMWVVDLNRQSLDRVVPDIAAARLVHMFEAAGWHVVVAKYGARLRALFDRAGGELLRRRLDAMPNEEYQWLLRAPSHDVRDRLLGGTRINPSLNALLAELEDDELRDLLRDLGGHDLELLLDAYGRCAQNDDRPSVVFAYTLKGWRLPTEAHPANHAALLTDAQLAELAARLGCDPDLPWAPFAAGSPEDLACQAAARRLLREPAAEAARPDVPVDLGRRHAGLASTQQTLGRFFVDLARTAPAVAARVVTVSPDVASSTNLGGWINKVGVWNPRDRSGVIGPDDGVAIRWQETPAGQHVELGIAEVNLVGLLGELGAAWRTFGQPLLPVGTLYDPFVGRCLEPWSFGIYAGGQSILIGTPSGVTLAPEGGAHQSIGTPSIGIVQPGCVAWEPCFAQDLEWALLEALSRLGQPGGNSAYFRLSTLPIDQARADLPAQLAARSERRRGVLAGGYWLRPATEVSRAVVIACGAVVPQALAARDTLLADSGLDVAVVCLTSPDLVFRGTLALRGLSDEPADPWIVEHLLPAARALPIVSVHDGHPHALAFLGAVQPAPQACLGVQHFGQSGTPETLYRHYGIDAETIIGAVLDLLP